VRLSAWDARNRSYGPANTKAAEARSVTHVAPVRRTSYP